jgi:hypothetical protein
MVVTIKIAVYWRVTPCSLTDRYKRIASTYCLRFTLTTVILEHPERCQESELIRPGRYCIQYRWERKVKLDLWEIVYEFVDWIQLPEKVGLLRIQ